MKIGYDLEFRQIYFFFKNSSLLFVKGPQG